MSKRFDPGRRSSGCHDAAIARSRGTSIMKRAAYLRLIWRGGVRLLAIAVLLVGCGGGPLSAIPSRGVPSVTPVPSAAITTSPSVALAWPNGWDTVVCLGVGSLHESSDQLKLAAQAATNGDVAEMANRADLASTSAQKAQAAFKGVPQWAPGASMVTALALSATAYREGADLVSRAATKVDEATLNAAIDKITAGGLRLNEAVVAMAIIPGFAGCAR